MALQDFRHHISQDLVNKITLGGMPPHKVQLNKGVASMIHQTPVLLRQIFNSL